MRLNQLRPAAGSRPNKVRKGRGQGSGSGKTAGRGHNGQKSRSGGTVPVGFEGGQMPLYRRVPKFGFISRSKLVRAEIRLSDLNQLDVDVISMDVLKEKKVLKHTIKKVKVIASGTIDRAVTLQGLAVTKGAKALIEKAGGKVE
jgi:large subunit ribosomal protein L15